MVFITVTCLVSCDCDQTTVRSYVTRRRSQAHPRLLPRGYRATSPRALAGGHRPKRSVASIAHFAQWADTKGTLRESESVESLPPPHPPPRKRGEGAHFRCCCRSFQKALHLTSRTPPRRESASRCRRAISSAGR